MCEAIGVNWFAGVHLPRFSEADSVRNVVMHVVCDDLHLEQAIFEPISQRFGDGSSMGNHAATLWDSTGRRLFQFPNFNATRLRTICLTRITI